MASATFSSDMLDGFDVLYRRTDEVLKSVTEVSKFFSALSSTEQAYGKSLQKVSQFNTTKKATSMVELGTIKASWETVHKELDALAGKHTTFSNQLLELSNGISKFQKEHSNVRALLMKKGQQLTKDLAAVMALLDKAKKDYESKCKSAESAAAALAKSKGEGTTKPKELAKLQGKSTKAMDAAKAADAEYKKQLEHANAKQKAFYEQDMPSLLAEFEDWERQRLTFLKEQFEQYSSLHSELPGFLDERSKAVHSVVSAVNVQADILEYIEKARTGVAVPSPIQFETYNTEFKLSDTGTRAPDAGHVDASRGGPTISTKASVADPSLMQDNDDESLAPEDRIAKLQTQQNDLREAIKAETKSKKGLEKLVKFYASDPVAQEKAKGELEDQKRKIQAMKDQRQKIEEKLSELQGGAVGGEAVDEAYYDEGEAYEEAYDEGYEGEYAEEYWQASALYDYEATNDTELSFGEGDVLTITERDDSGWWFAELNGVSGFIPNNYVEIIGE